jgi:hypothetical protein
VAGQNESRDGLQNGTAVSEKDLGSTDIENETNVEEVVSSRSVEQIEAAREIVETEISYGNDLAVIRNVSLCGTKLIADICSCSAKQYGIS